MFRFAVVTLAGVDGLSTEQRKRLTMAVELVTQPRVLFCDEPTSRLDGRGAMMVARVMQAVTCRGVAVVSTIHQPSAAIFGMFDELLLQRGGKIVFNGPLGADAVNLVRYLQGAVPAAPAFVQVGALAAGSWQRLSCAGGASGTCKRTCMHACMHAGLLEVKGQLCMSAGGLAADWLLCWHDTWPLLCSPVRTQPLYTHPHTYMYPTSAGHMQPSLLDV